MAKQNSEWLRHQAEVQKEAKAKKVALTLEQQEAAAKEKLQEILSGLAKRLAEQQGRIQRLAEWHAERCMRVRELLKQLRREWERAEAAEALVIELTAQLDALKSAGKKANGHAGLALVGDVEGP